METGGNYKNPPAGTSKSQLLTSYILYLISFVSSMQIYSGYELTLSGLVVNVFFFFLQTAAL